MIRFTGRHFAINKRRPLGNGVRVVAEERDSPPTKNIQADAGAQPASKSLATVKSFPWSKTAVGLTLTIRPHLMPSLRTNRSVPPLRLYAIMAWTGIYIQIFTNADPTVTKRMRTDVFTGLSR